MFPCAWAKELTSELRVVSKWHSSHIGLKAMWYRISTQLCGYGGGPSRRFDSLPAWVVAPCRSGKHPSLPSDRVLQSSLMGVKMSQEGCS